MKGFIKKLLRESLEDLPQIKILKKGTIKVGLTKDYVGDEIHVTPSVKISDAKIDTDSLNEDKYYYRSLITVADTNGNISKSMDLIYNQGRVNGYFSYGKKVNKLKLSSISRDILIYSKETNKVVNTINIDTYKLENHNDNGYITLPDDVGRVYANGVVKKDDDAAIWLGSKKVYRKGGKGLNSKDNEELYKNWEDKIAMVGKYKGDKYGDIITKDKNYFNWFLQNVAYYEPSPNTKYDIRTTFNSNLYDKLKSDGIL